MSWPDYIADGTWQKREEIELKMMEEAIEIYGDSEKGFSSVISDEYPCREILYYGNIKVGEIPNMDEISGE